MVTTALSIIKSTTETDDRTKNSCAKIVFKVKMQIKFYQEHSVVIFIPSLFFLESLGFESAAGAHSVKPRLSAARRSIHVMNGITGSTNAGPMPHVSQ